MRADNLPLSSIQGLNQNEVIRFLVDWSERFPDRQLYLVEKIQITPGAVKAISAIYNYRWENGFYSGELCTINLEKTKYAGELLSDQRLYHFKIYEFDLVGKRVRIEAGNGTPTHEELEFIRQSFLSDKTVRFILDKESDDTLRVSPPFALFQTENDAIDNWKACVETPVPVYALTEYVSYICRVDDGFYLISLLDKYYSWQLALRDKNGSPEFLAQRRTISP
ncbi:hypothetical protein H5P28_06935 [Ruficoccus amylovorans]|uniref:Uncharacterized protein n=1 Tax=Ruficoccus amylovorans TaxID=1804625 RepID=A0A842HEN9_9BACT|nr:hypothetical protein [Ruficoccus amylovorans]MBC2593994.1 hypothetical protein [Ruficoccus amylovorans]